MTRIAMAGLDPRDSRESVKSFDATDRVLADAWSGPGRLRQSPHRLGREGLGHADTA